MNTCIAPLDYFFTFLPRLKAHRLTQVVQFVLLGAIFTLLNTRVMLFLFALGAYFPHLVMEQQHWLCPHPELLT
ncbi:hypothetical protein, partial [Cronobacter sakazakii]|uniref:hypothetical protein n=1 Tax=Cronobacter sakazakii TaxID=28141 RepID=UPI0010560A1F